MKGVFSKIRLVCCAALVSGCISSNTRLPTLGYNDTRAERQSLDYINPLPERETSKEIERPRGFEYQRAEPRRALERSAETGRILNSRGVPAGMNPSASNYPESVSP